MASIIKLQGPRIIPCELCHDHKSDQFINYGPENPIKDVWICDQCIASIVEDRLLSKLIKNPESLKKEFRS